ncbi:MAG: phosphatidylglycerophosphatase A [Pseudomonadales bacterium]|nr:phosphatidylglycerophosphatase A [Pseudomonadales bacterium]
MLLVTGFGSGFFPRGPGTAGSLVALAIWWWALAPLHWTIQAGVVVVVFVAGTWLTARVARRHGVGDDPAIVVDEFVGLWLALLAAPATPAVAAAGFLLFRLLDIWKPGPVRFAERRAPGAFGVMLDDVVAGLITFGVLQVALLVIG